MNQSFGLGFPLGAQPTKKCLRLSILLSHTGHNLEKKTVSKLQSSWRVRMLPIVDLKCIILARGYIEQGRNVWITLMECRQSMAQMYCSDATTSTFLQYSLANEFLTKLYYYIISILSSAILRIKYELGSYFLRQTFAEIAN
jgi:hypothetical protein